MTFIKTNLSLIGLALCLVFFSGQALSADRAIPLVSNQEYSAATKTGKPVFVAFNADWCPVCMRQNRALSSIKSEFTGKAYIFSIDWDKKDDFVGPKTNQRSTIALIKDGKIADQLIGETNADKIKAFILSHL